MLDIFSQIDQWASEKREFATATVIKTWGSSPRPVGSVLAVDNNMEMLGSVSGGCIEGAVVKEALAVLESGVPKRVHYGVSDEEAWEVGLSCGGKVEVFIEPFVSTLPEEAPVWQSLQEAVSQNQSCVFLSNMSSAKPQRVILDPLADLALQPVDPELGQAGLQAYRERKTQSLQIGEAHWFAQVLPRKSQLILVGAAHITVDLVVLAQSFGFETIVIDPRGIFAEKTQFPVAPDQLHVDWPAEILPQYTLDSYTYLVMLTHDPKIDDQALHLALRSEVGYIGALGSRRTAAKRRTRLMEAGFTETEIDRIHGPVGIDIRAKKPREIALSIMAQIIAVQNEFM
jgi:xanthine dehydrogenase accessory factor